MKRVASPGSIHDTGCLGLVHWDDPGGWYGEGGRRRVQDGVYLWQIHVDIWQNQYNIVKLKKKIKFKKMWVKLPQPWGISLICLKVKVKAALSRARHFASQWTVHGILQDRIPEWVAYLFSRGSPQLRDPSRVSCTSGRFFTSWSTKEAQMALEVSYIEIRALAMWILHFYPQGRGSMTYVEDSSWEGTQL